MVSPPTARPGISLATRGGNVVQPVLLSANVQTSTHPDGLPHVQSTIRKMSELSRAGGATYPIRNLATRIVHDVPSKQYVAELAALYRWVRDNIRYRKDPVRVEWVQSPARTVLEQAGDCDDISTLLAALAQALGHETRFRTVGKSRGEQQHVAVEVLIDGNWLSIDPVLEPPASSTAPRADLGRFGQRAPGARIVWNSEGSMLAGYRRARRRSLSGVVGPAARTLWDWNPYFPPVGIAQDSGFSIPQGSVAARPDSPYRASDAPGFFGNRNLRTLAAKSGDPTSPVFRPLAGLGEGWTVGQVRVTTSDVAALRNYLNKGSDWLAKASSERPAQARLESVRARIASDDYFAAQQWASLSRASRNWIRDHYGPPKGIEKFAQGAVKLVTKVGSSLPGKILAPVLAQNADPKLRAIQDKVLQKIPLPQAQALRAAGSSVAQFADRASSGNARQVSAPKLVSKGATPAAGWKAPHRKLAAKYPRNAKQVFDRAHGVFRVYVPTSKLSGLGAVRPTISFALGANAPSGSSSSGMAALARNAVNAVAAFTKQHGAPPQVKLPAVLALQQADAQLTDDGLYGPNAQAAAAFYLGTPASQLPAVATPYKKYAVTWRAPSSSAPAAISRPAPAPAVTTVNTPKALAMNAVNAVRAFKSPPTGSVPAVLAFQRADDLLLDDGKYGPNVQLAAAYYLGVPTSTLPPFAPAFKNTKITWHAPGTAAPVASKPAAAGKPASSKPAAVPTAVVGPATIKPKPVATSSSAPKPPPAPLPGYTEVGHETDNPGLAPVPAASSSSSAPGQHTVTTASGGKVVQLDPILITAAPPKAKKKPAKKPSKPSAAMPPPPMPVSSPGAPAPAYDLPAPGGAAPSGGGYVDTMPELGPPPIPAGSSYADFEATGAAQAASSESSSSNMLLLLAAAYLYSKHKKKRAA